TRTRRFLARFSEPVRSVHAPSWADFITTTPELKFSVHTRAYMLDRSWFHPLLEEMPEMLHFPGGSWCPMAVAYNDRTIGSGG
ncbi:hypothetical protein, partial [Bradyrhizobium sp. Leo121]|uniref:hypothetical protein n=1 Tax=Bradyrhizobium sp. Leo121 TaxID=1571195 RepID=UPI001A912C62